jgi:hypothetical protein
MIACLPLSYLHALQVCNLSTAILTHNLDKNPNILELKKKLTKFADGRSVSLVLENYVNSVIDIPLEEHSLRYHPVNNKFVISEPLSKYSNENGIY